MADWAQRIGCHITADGYVDPQQAEKLVGLANISDYRDL
jgi:hypothetical protein